MAYAPTPPPRIGLICFSAIPDDPRVRRQGDLFHSRGWRVVAIGLPGARSPSPEWPCLDDISDSGSVLATPLAQNQSLAGASLENDDAPSIDEIADPSQAARGYPEAQKHPDASLTGPRSNILQVSARRCWQAAKRILRRLRRIRDIAFVYADKRYADRTYWTLNTRFEALYQLGRSQQVDIWLANDWTALPIARRLAAEQRKPYAYDTHELAIDEYAERLRWRIAQRPVIDAVEREGMKGAAVISCVSEGIADRLYEYYDLPKKPLLIRNMPRYEILPFRPTGERIEVLYHGVVNIGRGLEACIDSVALWRPEFRLTIRGPGPSEYLASLSKRIHAAGLGDRILLAPPVPMVDLVKEASHFDIGLFALPGHSAQNVHVLPNKFFEYVMAGLALCVSDLPEMARLLQQNNLGRLISEVTPSSIASAINGFDRVTIDACKRTALEAAKTLNWEAEADRLFVAIEQAVLFPSTPPTPAEK